jgi:hypothetical protein
MMNQSWPESGLDQLFQVLKKEKFVCKNLDWIRKHCMQSLLSVSLREPLLIQVILDEEGKEVLLTED